MKPGYSFIFRILPLLSTPLRLRRIYADQGVAVPPPLPRRSHHENLSRPVDHTGRRPFHEPVGLGSCTQDDLLSRRLSGDERLLERLLELDVAAQPLLAPGRNRRTDLGGCRRPRQQQAESDHKAKGGGPPKRLMRRSRTHSAAAPARA